MKKLMTLAFCALMACSLAGCATPGDPFSPPDINQVLQETQKIYLDVRTVVTDPEVMPLFTAEELERLADLERKYLEAAKRMKAFPEDAEAIEQISWIATEILTIIGEVESIEKYQPYVAAIRISIQILRNHL
jgi:predicted RNA-binding protein with EMAP domain